MSFKDIKNSAIVLDFNNQVYRSFHATEKQNMHNDDGINVGCIIGLIKVIIFAKSKANKLGYDPELIICEDRYPTRKKDIYKNYQEVFKDYDKTIIYKDRPKKDQEYNPIEICRKYIDCIPHTKIYMEREEADDVIASFISKNKNNFDYIDLYSTDKDLWQLIDKCKNLNITLGDGEEVDSDRVSDKFDGGSFKHIHLHKIIRGDSSDNVKSVYRFQFKKTVKSFLRCDGTVDDYLKCIKEDFGSDSKEYLKLLDNVGLMAVNYLITELKHDLKYEVEIIPNSNRFLWHKLCLSFQTPSIRNAPIIDSF